MYQLIIVEDEAMVRKGLSCIVDWSQLGFELTNCFEDGKDIIAYLENKNQVDVILCDIKMNDISGIDVAKYIFEHNIKTKIIFLSAYKEFDLAQQAVKYHVYDYLLKPTEIEDINIKFRELKKVLDYEKQCHEKVQHNNQTLTTTLEIVYKLMSDTSSTDTHPVSSQSNPVFFHGNAKLHIYLVECIHDKKNSTQISDDLNSYFNINNNKINISVIPRDFNTFFILCWGDLSIQDIDEFINQKIDMINCTTDLKINMMHSKSLVLSDESHSDNLTFQNRDVFEVVDELIINNISNKITLESICKDIYMNPCYFSRYFKQKKGLNFSEYILKMRIEYAKQLISENKYYIYEIGDRVGIKNYKYFHKVFKTEVGCSPAQFKDSILNLNL